jgi:hypothetical protein
MIATTGRFWRHGIGGGGTSESQKKGEREKECDGKLAIETEGHGERTLWILLDQPGGGREMMWGRQKKLAVGVGTWLTE